MFEISDNVDDFFEPMGAGLEYTQLMDAFKWGIGLQSYLQYDPFMSLYLQGAWVFQRQRQWMASLGVRLGGAAALIEYWQETIGLHVSPFISFEYFLNETFSFFIALHILVDPLDISFKKGKSLSMGFEVPLGVSFYF